MSDRELLELAAKAIGLEGDYCEMCGDEPALYHNEANLGFWAPLTDDGDALRLAAKLAMDICFSEISEQTHALAVNRAGDVIECCERWGNDKLDATRRAIVRCAATIGDQA